MSEDINNSILVGRLTKDAELSYTNAGTAICRMSIAVNESVKKDGEWVDDVSFFDLNLWGSRAECLEPYLKKGQQLIAEGRLRQERWENEGQKRSKVILNIRKIQLIGRKLNESIKD